MPRLVERRADQVVHRRIDDDKVPGRPVLDVEHARNEHAGIADDPTSRLERQLEVEAVGQALDHGAESSIARGAPGRKPTASPPPETEPLKAKPPARKPAAHSADPGDG